MGLNLFWGWDSFVNLIKAGILLQKTFIHWYLYKPCIWLTLTMQSITEPLTYTLVLRKLSFKIFSSVFKDQDYWNIFLNHIIFQCENEINRIMKHVKRIKKFFDDLQYQKIPLNVPKGTPRMICALYPGRRDQVVEPRTQLPFIP